jgi:hypothetical protein
MQRRLPTLMSAFGAAGAIVLGACADEPTRPTTAAGPPAEALQSLQMSADARAGLRGALLFTRDHSLLALERREAADAVAAAFSAVAERVEKDDRVGLERAVGAARKAIERYRAIAGPEHVSAIDLEAAMLTLDHAAALAREADASRTDHSSRSATRTHDEDHQP